MDPIDQLHRESEIRTRHSNHLSKIRKEHNIEIEKFRSLLKEIKAVPLSSELLAKIDEALLVECPTCEGKGEAVFSCCGGEMVDDDIMMCPTCHEHLGPSECDDCGGTGKVPEDKEEFIEKIPGLQARAENYADSLKDH